MGLLKRLIGGWSLEVSVSVIPKEGLAPQVSGMDRERGSHSSSLWNGPLYSKRAFITSDIPKVSNTANLFKSNLIYF